MFHLENALDVKFYFKFYQVACVQSEPNKTDYGKKKKKRYLFMLLVKAKVYKNNYIFV